MGIENIDFSKDRKEDDDEEVWIGGKPKEESKKRKNRHRFVENIEINDEAKKETSEDNSLEELTKKPVEQLSRVEIVRLIQPRLKKVNANFKQTGDPRWLELSRSMQDLLDGKISDKDRIKTLLKMNLD